MSCASPAEASTSALRGSHLLLPAWRLPVAHAFSFMHATDRRPVFVFPWEGATVVGTTDLDHRDGLGEDARISRAELDYLLAACAQQFPAAAIEARDVLSTWAGVRPVVSSGDDSGKPSDEKREHVLWREPGCVTLAGGKLTTFRPLAVEVLQACAPLLGRTVTDDGAAVFGACEGPLIDGLGSGQRRRLAGRYGRDLVRLKRLVDTLGTDCVGASETLWAELAFAAEAKWCCISTTCCCAAPASACCCRRRRGIPAAYPRTLPSAPGLGRPALGT